jgi:hypothetical protein
MAALRGDGPTELHEHLDELRGLAWETELPELLSRLTTLITAGR